MNIERPEGKQPIPPHAKKVFEGIVFDVYQWEQELFDGSKAVFEKIKRVDTALVFPVLEDGRIIVMEQEQPGKSSYLSSIGGRMEKGETPLEAVKREMLEETGFAAENFTLWKAGHPNSKIDWVIYHFIAKGVRKVADPSPEAGERIKLKYLSFDEFIELGFNQRFSEKEIIPDLVEAKFDQDKRAALQELFNPRKPI